MSLNHLGTKELETERLVLRKITIEDAKEMFYSWASDPVVTKYLPWNAHENVDITRKVIGTWIEAYKVNFCYQWVIALRDTNELIGTISVVKIEENISCCEVGYCIGRKYWGKGYTPEALREVIRFLFKEVGFNRIEANYDRLNVNSGKVMQKAGMTYEGMLREKALDNKGNLIDIDLYSILKKEYKK